MNCFPYCLIKRCIHVVVQFAKRNGKCDLSWMVTLEILIRLYILSDSCHYYGQFRGFYDMFPLKWVNDQYLHIQHTINYCKKQQYR
jgi:hypothetical protein